ncbi:hypothetical protein Btru_055989 [Bulinus truncatus]|nr:hypothetical protein Btru_055989 [Bulinus truncatus]
MDTHLSHEVPKYYSLKFLADGSFGEVHLVVDKEKPNEQKFVIKKIKIVYVNKESGPRNGETIRTLLTMILQEKRYLEKHWYLTVTGHENFNQIL